MKSEAFRLSLTADLTISLWSKKKTPKKQLNRLVLGSQQGK